MTISVTPIPRLIDLAAPAFTLGVANAAGSAETAVASDSTLLVFDTTLPDAITFGQSGAVGTSTTAARRSHAHAMAAEPTTTAASQAEMEAGSSTTVFATPGRIQYAPGVGKVWWSILADGTLSSPSYNVASVTDTGTGNRTVIFDTDFSSAIYAVFTAIYSTNDANFTSEYSGAAAGQVVIKLFEGTTLVDQAHSGGAFGDQ